MSPWGCKEADSLATKKQQQQYFFYTFRISAVSISFKHFTYKYNTSLLSIPIITFFKFFFTFFVYSLGLFSPQSEYQVLSDCVDSSVALRAGAYRRSRNVNGVRY